MSLGNNIQYLSQAIFNLINEEYMKDLYDNEYEKKILEERKQL